MSTARASSAKSRISERVWWYFRVRRPVSVHTTRNSPRSLSARAVSSTVRSSRSITGSRLLVWLQAVRRLKSVSGYDAGTVTCFSRRLPRIRCSTGSRSMRRPYFHTLRVVVGFIAPTSLPGARE